MTKRSQFEVSRYGSDGRIVLIRGTQIWASGDYLGEWFPTLLEHCSIEGGHPVMPLDCGFHLEADFWSEITEEVFSRSPPMQI